MSTQTTTTTATTVLITGGGGGLGKATATAFLHAGANVAVCDVNAERLAATERDWAAAGVAATRFLTAVVDVTDEAQVRALFAAAAARFGRVDVLVNNAGLVDNFSPVGECSREQWDRVLAVNVTGPFLASRAALAQFLSKDEEQSADEQAPQAQAQAGSGGVILNILSIAARHGSCGGAAYVTSKHALAGLSKNTAFHYAHRGVYSVALVLGGMATNIADGMRQGAGLNAEAYMRFKAAHSEMDPERDLLPLDLVSKYIVFLSDRAVARASNGALLDFTNNWPEA